MGKKSRDKGARFEREIVNAAKAHGIDAFRVPLSGSAAGFKDDIELRLGDETWRIEAKKRANGFKRVYEWLGEADVLRKAVGKKDAPFVAVFPAGDVQQTRGRSGRSIEIKRLVVTGIGGQAIRNAKIIYELLADNHFALTNFNIGVLREEQPSTFANENDVYFANMRVRLMIAQFAGLV